MLSVPITIFKCKFINIYNSVRDRVAGLLFIELVVPFFFFGVGRFCRFGFGFSRGGSGFLASNLFPRLIPLYIESMQLNDYPNGNKDSTHSSRLDR